MIFASVEGPQISVLLIVDVDNIFLAVSWAFTNYIVLVREVIRVVVVAEYSH